MLATKDYHSVFDIPNGATLSVVAKDIVGNANADATFWSGAEGVDDADWTLAQMENGQAQTPLAGAGVSTVRVKWALAQGAELTLEMTVESAAPDFKTRKRTWLLRATDADKAGRLGWLIDVEGGA